MKKRKQSKRLEQYIQKLNNMSDEEVLLGKRALYTKSWLTTIFGLVVVLLCVVVLLIVF